MVLQVGAAMLTLISIDTVSSAKLRSSMLQPYGAVTVGTVAGVVSCLGYKVLTGRVMEKLGIHDTCGVNNLHGVPGLMAKEEAKAKEVRVIGAKDLAEDRRMEAKQDACNIRLSETRNQSGEVINLKKKSFGVKM